MSDSVAWSSRWLTVACATPVEPGLGSMNGNMVSVWARPSVPPVYGRPQPPGPRSSPKKMMPPLVCVWARLMAWPISCVNTPAKESAFGRSPAFTAAPFITIQPSVSVDPLANSGEAMPSTPGGAPKKLWMSVPSVSYSTWMPPPLNTPTTWLALAAVMSGRPILLKSPTTDALNDEVGTALHVAAASAVIASAWAFVTDPKGPRSVYMETDGPQA